MANDPNRLAWKGSPGPWKYNNDGILHGITVNGLNDIIGYFGSMTGELSEENLANAHMASAAPEAVEFIADLLDICDYNNSISQVIELPAVMIARAEEILKKAYNF